MTLYTGWYGFAMIPDDFTCGTAKGLAQFLRYEVPFTVSAPHVTLFHAHVEEVSHEWVMEALKALQSVSGAPLSLFRMYCFGKNFVFWEAERSPAFEEAHTLALSLLSPYANVKEVRKGEAEHTPRQEENRRKCGHPLVLEDWVPHITLAHHPEGITRTIRPQFAFEGRVERVVFAEFASPGRLLRTVAST